MRGLASVSIVDTDLSKGFTGLARNRGDEERQGLETGYAICSFLLERALQRGVQQRSG